MNSRLTKKDRALIKAALRKAFARSELHKKVLNASIIEHSDPSRPRVKTWCRCNKCKQPEAKSYMDVDHVVPWVPLDTTWEDWVLKIGIDAATDFLWCDETNLQVICETCHNEKTASEKALKASLKPPKPKKPRQKKPCAKT